VLARNGAVTLSSTNAPQVVSLCGASCSVSDRRSGHVNSLSAGNLNLLLVLKAAAIHVSVLLYRVGLARIARRGRRKHSDSVVSLRSRGVDGEVSAPNTRTSATLRDDNSHHNKRRETIDSGRSESAE
jgi:hypothetical protein